MLDPAHGDHPSAAPSCPLAPPRGQAGCSGLRGGRAPAEQRLRPSCDPALPVSLAQRETPSKEVAALARLKLGVL